MTEADKITIRFWITELEEQARHSAGIETSPTGIKYLAVGTDKRRDYEHRAELLKRVLKEAG